MQGTKEALFYTQGRSPIAEEASTLPLNAPENSSTICFELVTAMFTTVAKQVEGEGIRVATTLCIHILQLWLATGLLILHVSAIVRYVAIILQLHKVRL